jgi:excisionase family DNA binding protein
MSEKDRKKKFRRGDLNRCGQDGKRLFLTVEDAARHFGVGKGEILRWVNKGAIPCHFLGGRIYLNREEVRQYWAMFGAPRGSGLTT